MGQKLMRKSSVGEFLTKSCKMLHDFAWRLQYLGLQLTDFHSVKGFWMRKISSIHTIHKNSSNPNYIIVNKGSMTELLNWSWKLRMLLEWRYEPQKYCALLYRSRFSSTFSQWSVRWIILLPPASAVEVLELVPFNLSVCLGLWDLRCRSLPGGVSIMAKGLLGKWTENYRMWEVHQRWGEFICYKVMFSCNTSVSILSLLQIKMLKNEQLVGTTPTRYKTHQLSCQLLKNLIMPQE